jgi:hypothetical protein
MAAFEVVRVDPSVDSSKEPLMARETSYFVQSFNAGKGGRPMLRSPASRQPAPFERPKGWH